MPLDQSKLTMVREKGSGHYEARCPACAEMGQDKQGVHLKVYPDGKFACVVNAGPHGTAHRRRIFALAGLRSEPKPVRLKEPPKALVKSISIAALFQQKAPARDDRGESNPF